MLTVFGVINCAKDEGVGNRLPLHFDVTLREPGERRTVCPVQTPATRGTTRVVTTGIVRAVPHRFTLPNSKINLNSSRNLN